MKRISLEDLIGYNSIVCDGNPSGSLVINQDNLLSALSVYDSYYDTDEMIASALFRSLIISHGFQDGNKRTAVLCLFDILPPKVSSSLIENISVRIAKGELNSVGDICNLLYKRSIESEVKSMKRYTKSSTGPTHIGGGFDKYYDVVDEKDAAKFLECSIEYLWDPYQLESYPECEYTKKWALLKPEYQDYIEDIQLQCAPIILDTDTKDVFVAEFYGFGEIDSINLENEIIPYVDEEE